MSWVSPVKDDKALHEFEDGLKKAGEKYYVLFEIGLGTGLKLPDILDFRNRDVRGKESIELNIGKKNIRRIFKIPEKLQREIFCYTEGKDPGAWSLAVSRAFRFRKAPFKRTGYAGDEKGRRGCGPSVRWRQHHAENFCLELL